MRIAIQGHPTRGKEVIQIFESLGGINTLNYLGNNPDYYYKLYENSIICSSTKIGNYKYYTLEEFEKDFPFKIGDIVLLKVLNKPYEIIALDWFMDKPCYRLDNGLHYTPETLTTYKEMKEERNITLTLDKAKEWYKKGGELKEIALQAFSEKELTKVGLPKTWEKFCTNYPIQAGEAIIDGQTSQIRRYNDIVVRYLTHDKNVCPSQKSAEAHLAMIQLEQLRDCYNNNSDVWGWSYSIIKRSGIPELVRGCDHDTFLRFNNETVAKEFLKNFRDLIEKAGDLI